jgi:hypothetical protein
MWANTEYAPEGNHVSIYRTCTPSYGINKRKRPEAQPYTLCLVCYSVVLLGRETSSLQLLAPLLLTGGKGADLVIRGNVVLNTLSARSTSTLLRDQICINSPSIRQVSGLAELSYATDFDYPSTHERYVYWLIHCCIRIMSCARQTAIDVVVLRPRVGTALRASSHARIVNVH